MGLGLYRSTLRQEGAIMKVMIKSLRAAIALLSIVALLDYYITTADVPPIVTSNDLYRICLLHLICLVFAAIDFLVCVKNEFRGGYVSLFLSVALLLLWFFSYRGSNFYIGTSEMNRITKQMLFSGMLFCIIQAILQGILIVRATR